MRTQKICNRALASILVILIFIPFPLKSDVLLFEYIFERMTLLNNATPQELADWTHQILNEQDQGQESVLLELGYVGHKVMEIGYPGHFPGNEDKKLAIELAERISMEHFDFKEVLLADLKYGPNGLKPSPDHYDHAILKTTLFLINFPPNFFFPFIDYKNIELETLTEEHFFSDRARFAAIGKLEDSLQTIGLRSALEISLEIIANVPEIDRLLKNQTACYFLNQAASYLDGTSPIGKDAETAQLLIEAVSQDLLFEGGAGDVLFFRHQNDKHFSLEPKNFTGEKALFYAAQLGHPEASFKYAEEHRAVEPFSEIARRFKIAELGGILEAADALTTLEEETGQVLSALDLRLAKIRAERYREERCA